MRLAFLLFTAILCLSASPGLESETGQGSIYSINDTNTLGFSESEWTLYQDSILTDFRKHLKKREGKFLKVPLQRKLVSNTGLVLAKADCNA